MLLDYDSFGLQYGIFRLNNLVMGQYRPCTLPVMADLYWASTGPVRSNSYRASKGPVQAFTGPIQQNCTGPVQKRCAKVYRAGTVLQYGAGTIACTGPVQAQYMNVIWGWSKSVTCR